LSYLALTSRLPGGPTLRRLIPQAGARPARRSIKTGISTIITRGRRITAAAHRPSSGGRGRRPAAFWLRKAREAVKIAEW